MQLTSVVRYSFKYFTIAMPPMIAILASANSGIIFSRPMTSSAASSRAVKPVGEMVVILEEECLGKRRKMRALRERA